MSMQIWHSKWPGPQNGRGERQEAGKEWGLQLPGYPHDARLPLCDLLLSLRHPAKEENCPGVSEGRVHLPTKMQYIPTPKGNQEAATMMMDLVLLLPPPLTKVTVMMLESEKSDKVSF